MSKQLKLTSAEEISLQDAQKRVYTFYIGTDDDGIWHAWTYHSIIQNAPHFCMPCDDRDDAYITGAKLIQQHLAMR